MDSWWLIGGTVIFLVLTVIGTIVYVSHNSAGGNSAAIPITPGTDDGASRLAFILLIIAVIIIIIAFFAYFNGFFNAYKTTPERLTLKYDYLAHYEPVKILQGATPATYTTTSSTLFKNLVPEFKAKFLAAVKALVDNKARVETAIGNAALTHDTKVFADYDFSVPCVKYVDFLTKNDKIVQPNQDLVVRVMTDTLAEAGYKNEQLTFKVADGSSSKTAHILNIIGMYILFYNKYPAIVAFCIQNNRCPFNI